MFGMMIFYWGPKSNCFDCVLGLGITEEHCVSPCEEAGCFIQLNFLLSFLAAVGELLREAVHKH